MLALWPVGSWAKISRSYVSTLKCGSVLTKIESKSIGLLIRSAERTYRLQTRTGDRLGLPLTPPVDPKNWLSYDYEKQAVIFKKNFGLNPKVFAALDSILKISDIVTKNQQLILQLKESEISFIHAHPIVGPYFLYVDQLAVKGTVQFTKDTANLPISSNLHSGAPGAFRHLFWAALAARYAMSDLAEEWLKAHELTTEETLSMERNYYPGFSNWTPNEEYWDHEMDVKNNDLGLNLAETHVCLKEGEIYEASKKMILDGKGWVQCFHEVENPHSKLFGKPKDIFLLPSNISFKDYECL